LGGGTNWKENHHARGYWRSVASASSVEEGKADSHGKEKRILDAEASGRLMMNTTFYTLSHKML
jgi:hypothetical protein